MGAALRELTGFQGLAAVAAAAAAAAVAVAVGVGEPPAPIVSHDVNQALMIPELR